MCPGKRLFRIENSPYHHREITYPYRLEGETQFDSPDYRLSAQARDAHLLQAR